MRRLLVTGVPGWLGDNFVESFYKNGGYGFDALRCLVAPWTPQTLVESLKARFPQLEVVVGDMQDTEAVGEWVKECHAILHSAGIIHVTRPREWFDVNYKGTMNLFDAARMSGTVKRFVYISSNAAAGESPSGELITESEESRPLSSYGLSKRIAEDALLSNPGSIEVVVLRPCMFYGTPVPGRHVEFFKRIQSGWTPLIGATLPRSMVHIQNLTDACVLALTTPGVGGEVFNIADEEVYSIDAYITAIADALQVRPHLLPLPSFFASFAYVVDQALEKVGVYNRSVHLLGESNWSVGLSIEKAKKRLGYSPKRTLREGVREAVMWSRERGLI